MSYTSSTTDYANGITKGSGNLTYQLNHHVTWGRPEGLRTACNELGTQLAKEVSAEVLAHLRGHSVLTPKLISETAAWAQGWLILRMSLPDWRDVLAEGAQLNYTVSVHRPSVGGRLSRTLATIDIVAGTSNFYSG